MSGPWTWEIVLVSEPDGAREAAVGYQLMAEHATKLTAVVTSLAKVPWQGEAAEAFRAYLSGLARSIGGAQDVADLCRAASEVGGFGLDALRDPAAQTANKLNEFVTTVENLEKDGTNFIEGAQIAVMKSTAQQELARVRGQRDDLMNDLAKTVNGGIDQLLDFRPPPAPDPSAIADPAQRAMVQKLHDEVAATQALSGDTERSREYAGQITNASNDLERLALIRKAADELSAAELDNLMDNLDPEMLSRALQGGFFPWAVSDAEQRELFNKLAAKLDLDSLNGLAEMMPDDYWHPNPYKDVPGLGDGLKPDGWLLSWHPIDGAGQPVTPESINPDDINQRGLGDCHLQSVLYTLASTPEGREQLANNIHLNPNGTYTVTLYKHDGTPLDVVVTPDSPMAETPDGWKTQYDDKNKLWVQLYEKAMAQTNTELSSQDPIDGFGQNTGEGYEGLNGGWPEEDYSRVTGQVPASIDNSTAGGMGAPALKAADDSGARMTLCTTGSNHDPLAGGHCYAVDSIDWDAKPPMVHLRNPWGFDHADITFDQLQKIDGHMTIAKG